MNGALACFYDSKLRQGRNKSSCLASKQTKWSKSSKKVKESIPWDVKAILLIDHLQTSKTITGEHPTVGFEDPLKMIRFAKIKFHSSTQYFKVTS